MVKRNVSGRGIHPLITFHYVNYRPVSKNYPDCLTLLWLSLRPYVLRAFTLDSFRRMALRCLECKPPLSAWPHRTLVTSRITQPHAVPRVQRSSLTANRHNIYILHLRHIKKTCRLNRQPRREKQRERENSSWERKTILSRLIIIQKERGCHDIIKVTRSKCMASLLMSPLQMRMSWLRHGGFLYKAHSVLLSALAFTETSNHSKGKVKDIQATLSNMVNCCIGTLCSIRRKKLIDSQSK